MTLIEILAVVVILGLLAVSLTVGITAKFGKAKHEIAKTQIVTIVGQIQAFQLERHSIPTASQGLKVLGDNATAIYYLDPSRLIDPWGNPYRYLVPGPAGKPFEVTSYGADNQIGGDGENADLSSSTIGN
jgi:general secretion pathway protein G